MSQMETMSRRWAVALAALTLLATACTSALGVTDLPSNTCGDVTATDACTFCLTGACCASFTACQQDPSCGSLLECAQACQQDQTCLNDCGGSYSSATVSQYNDFATCTSSCASDCAGDGG